MLYGYTTDADGFAVTNLVPFNNVPVQTGSTATLVPGSSVVNLNRPGCYKVDFSAVAAASSSTTGDLAVIMQVNGEDYPGATSSDSSTSPTDTGSMAFSTIVKVSKECGCGCQSPTSITFRNAGIEATYFNAAVTVTKLA